MFPPPGKRPWGWLRASQGSKDFCIVLELIPQPLGKRRGGLTNIKTYVNILI
jgi:hypothetical protein